VQSVAAKKAADTDDGVVFAGCGKGTGSGGDFERAGDANDAYVFLICACT
jgi:hypothetical protein